MSYAASMPSRSPSMSAWRNCSKACCRPVPTGTRRGGDASLCHPGLARLGPVPRGVCLHGHARRGRCGAARWRCPWCTVFPPPRIALHCSGPGLVCCHPRCGPHLVCCTSPLLGHLACVPGDVSAPRRGGWLALLTGLTQIRLLLLWAERCLQRAIHPPVQTSLAIHTSFHQRPQPWTEQGIGEQPARLFLPHVRTSDDDEWCGRHTQCL